MATAARVFVDDLKTASRNGGEDVLGPYECSRCRGLMVIEQCFDFLDETGHLDFLARRCVQCGEVVDSVILQNRQRQLPVWRGATYSSSGF